jgi:hypothetical protein
VIDQEFEGALHSDSFDVSVGSGLRVALEKTAEVFGGYSHGLGCICDAWGLKGVIEQPDFCLAECFLGLRKVAAGPVGHRTKLQEKESESAGADVLGEGVIGFSVTMEAFEQVRDFGGFSDTADNALEKSCLTEQGRGFGTHEIHVIF